MGVSQATSYTSKQLVLGQIYTRAELKEKFEIVDATLNTGVFQPKGSKSIWLFITEKKSADRTPYDDLLEVDTLHWQGQMKGRTDGLIINHNKNELELIIFYRRYKYEFAHAGFQFKGQFDYLGHTGDLPKSFLLKRREVGISTAAIQEYLEQTGHFNPTDITDGQDKVLTSIVRRRGQASFRMELMKAYSGQCAVTGCTLKAILEAAHIVPYMGVKTNHVQNGLLLRADIHTLFDLHLISIDPDNYKINIAPEISESEYAYLAGQTIHLPLSVIQRPSYEALKVRQNCKQML